MREIIADGADAHIDRMARKYLGKDSYPWRSANEQRRLLKVAIEHAGGMG